MTITRRNFLQAAGAAAATTMWPSHGSAQALRKVTFSQAWLPDGSSMFIYVAKNKDGGAFGERHAVIRGVQIVAGRIARIGGQLPMSHE